MDSLCCPSRSSVPRGQYAHTHTGATDTRSTAPVPRARTSGTPGGLWAKKTGVDRPTLATWLDQAGYFTAESGKFLNGYSGQTGPPGWDFWRQKAGNYFDFKVAVNGQWVSYTHGEYEADVVTDHAVAGIEASGTTVRVPVGRLLRAAQPLHPAAPVRLERRGPRVRERGHPIAAVVRRGGARRGWGSATSRAG